MDVITFEKAKSTLLFATPLLIICGTLYNIAYWDTFGINGLEYVDVLYIIKSFVYPFLGFALTQIIIAVLTFEANENLQILPYGQGTKSKLGDFLNLPIVVVVAVVIWIVFIYRLYFQGGFYGWLAWSYWVSVVPSLFIDRTGVLNKTIVNSKLRVRLIKSIMFTISFSFGAGKYNSQLIYNNIKYKYIIQKVDATQKADTLKLIAMVNEKIFLTDMKNKQTIICSYNKFDSIVLYHQK